MRKMPPAGSNARIVLDVLIKNLPEWPGAVEVCNGDEAAALAAMHELFCAGFLKIEINEGDGTFRLLLSGALAPAKGSA